MWYLGKGDNLVLEERKKVRSLGGLFWLLHLDVA